jgi:hypothetical protein
MCDWSHVAGHGYMSWLPQHDSDQYTFDSLGGVIFEHTQSRELQGAVAPNVAEIL